MQAFLHKDLGRINVQHSYFRREDQVIIIRNIVSRRAKTVAVKHCSHHITVREQDRSRTVPRLHHSRIILVEILLVLGHAPVVYPWLRDTDHHCKRKIHAAHYHKFKGVVEHS